MAAAPGFCYMWCSNLGEFDAFYMRFDEYGLDVRLW
jgi:hypothetical protein